MESLGCSYEELADLDKSQLMKAIKDRRKAIRYHRDQIGDDRCWLDDGLVWAALNTTPAEPKVLPDYEKMMEHCSAFFYKRQEKEFDQIKDQMDETKWDEDLHRLDETGLLNELLKLQTTILEHRERGQLNLTVADDKKLYEILPEGLKADFRLPSEAAFLGGTVDPCAGCPNFWKSHQSCGTKQHNLRKWGKC